MKVHKNACILYCISFLPVPFNLACWHSPKCIHKFQNILNSEFIENICRFPSISSSIFSMRYMEKKVNNSITCFFLKIICLFFCVCERDQEGEKSLLLTPLQNLPFFNVGQRMKELRTERTNFCLTKEQQKKKVENEENGFSHLKWYNFSRKCMSSRKHTFEYFSWKYFHFVMFKWKVSQVKHQSSHAEIQ